MNHDQLGKELKRKAKAQGNFVSIDFNNVFDLVKSLEVFFYQKKHEWMAICFLNADYSCNCIWFNKGPSYQTVTPKLSPEKVVTTARELSASHVLFAHNHPITSKEFPAHGSKTQNIQAAREQRLAQLSFSDDDKKAIAPYEEKLTEAGMEIANVVVVAGESRFRDNNSISKNYKSAKGPCFIVTFCFDVNSREHRLMTCFRDNVLRQSRLGRCITRLYYRISPAIVHLANKMPILQKLLLPAITHIALPIAHRVLEKSGGGHKERFE